ncbi:hypothetical protein FDG2_4258 [Candidatus Protofrankia californiensis]|uniref:NADP-dependent oxidoreductase domain-containing protein n=1 Tax=Candidatus Protofrankia californiensis TaxID=1839754 RepID=A0A1C3P4D1_9ACTN|nr:hypothetical protein FDG2_4258 [Candidatus Protofrankia californiensis]
MAEIPGPETLMVRAGLLVGEDVMDATEVLAASYGLNMNGRWGMSPFGGNAKDAVWDAVNVAQFLDGGQKFSNQQAIFRLAYELPIVSSVVVGTNSPAHLKQMVEATTLRANREKIGQYRQLLRERAGQMKTKTKDEP